MPTSIIDPFSIAEGLLKVLCDFRDSVLRKSRDSSMIFTHFLYSVMIYSNYCSQLVVEGPERNITEPTPGFFRRIVRHKLIYFIEDPNQDADILQSQ